MCVPEFKESYFGSSSESTLWTRFFFKKRNCALQCNCINPSFSKLYKCASFCTKKIGLVLWTTSLTWRKLHHLWLNVRGRWTLQVRKNGWTSQLNAEVWKPTELIFRMFYCITVASLGCKILLKKTSDLIGYQHLVITNFDSIHFDSAKCIRVSRCHHFNLIWFASWQHYPVTPSHLHDISIRQKERKCLCMHNESFFVHNNMIFAKPLRKLRRIPNQEID